MVKLEILTPYPCEGETQKQGGPGDTLNWAFRAWKHPDAPDRLATIAHTFPAKPSEDGWPDPKRDFTLPKYTVDGKEHTIYDTFMFTGPHTITVQVTLTKDADPQGRPIIIDFDVYPAIDP